LKTVKINLLINQDGDPLDLTGATVRLAVKKPDKTTVLQDFTVVDALAGSCEIVLNTQAYVVDGKYDAEVMVYYGVDTVAVTGQFSYRAVKGILDDGTVESTNEWQSITQAIADASRPGTVEEFTATAGQTVFTLANAYELAKSAISVEIDGVPQTVGEGYTETSVNSITLSEGATTGAKIRVIIHGFAVGEDVRFATLTSSLAESATKIAPLIMKPLYVETMATMGRYGTGVPSGVASYTGGNYVCTINGTKGQNYVTVTSGVIADGGGVWNAVIQDQNLNCYMNKVLSINGNTFQLVDPLPVDIVNGKIGNLHDSSQGLHYTEIGYYAFAQRIYNANPRHAEREKNDIQFLGTDTSSNLWVLNTSFSIFNNVTNVNNTDDSTLAYYGTAHLDVNLADPTHYAQFSYTGKDKGYIEMYISSKNPATLDFTKNGAVVKTISINKLLQRVVLEFSKGDVLLVKVYDATASGSNVNTLRIGNTTVFLNSVFKTQMINPNDKVAYIGDSWGTYHNSATTRELQRLMNVAGGTGSVANYSRAGHTSVYALNWFNEYIIKTKPDKVIIEYYCNDFASINGTNIGTFSNVNGQQQDMNVASMAVYLNNIYQMCDMAIQNGIQPIVIMADVTDALTRVQDFCNKLSGIWLGDQLNKSTIDTAQVNTSKIQQNGNTSPGNGLKIVSTEINSGTRQGTIFDTNVNITGGNLITVKNNGVQKYALKYDGTPILPQTQITPQYGTQVANTANRGLLYTFDGQGGATKIDDQLRIVLEKADGTFVTKYVRLETWGNAAPTTGSYNVGDLVYNTNPTAGGYIGWVCVAGGSPGTWKGYGAIQV
jgi:hypothetical protein